MCQSSDPSLLSTAITSVHAQLKNSFYYHCKTLVTLWRYKENRSIFACDWRGHIWWWPSAGSVYNCIGDSHIKGRVHMHISSDLCPFYKIISVESWGIHCDHLTRTPFFIYLHRIQCLYLVPSLVGIMSQHIKPWTSHSKHRINSSKFI